MKANCTDRHFLKYAVPLFSLKMHTSNVLTFIKATWMSQLN